MRRVTIPAVDATAADVMCANPAVKLIAMAPNCLPALSGLFIPGGAFIFINSHVFARAFNNLSKIFCFRPPLFDNKAA